MHVSRTDYLDAALSAVLRVSACEGDIRQRKLLEADYKIVEMLMSNGADPDAFQDSHRGGQSTTARDLVSRHPDPRVRNLIFKAPRPSRPM